MADVLIICKIPSPDHWLNMYITVHVCSWQDLSERASARGLDQMIWGVLCRFKMFADEIADSGNAMHYLLSDDLVLALATATFP